MTVCTGNICRSVLSCSLLKQAIRSAGLDGIQVFSSGTRAQPWYRVYGVLELIYRDQGIDAAGHEALKTTPDMVREADLILVMEYRHRDEILSIAPGVEEKIYLLKEFAGLDGDPEIEDPLGHPDDAYYACLELLQEAVRLSVDRLRDMEDE